MIVDVHTHFFSSQFMSAYFLAEAAKARGYAPNFDCTVEDYQQKMSEVDYTFVFGMQAHHCGLVVPNAFVAEAAARIGPKAIPFASVDPTQAKFMAEAEDAVGRLGMRGLKLGPTYANVDARDARLDPLYAWAQHQHLPIVFHLGTTFVSNAPLAYAHPEALDAVAIRYPDLRLVVAHMGHPWMEEAIVLVRKHPHVYADVSALWYRPWQYYNALVLAEEYGVTSKLLFGSDYPISHPAETLTGHRGVNRVVTGTGLPRVSDETIERIVHQPALELLGIEP